MEEAGLQGARFFHYIAVTALFGVSLFPLYSSAKPSLASPPFYLHYRPWCVLALVSAVLWLVFTTAAMAGELAALTHWETWQAVLFESAFGPIWIARLGLAAILTFVTAPQRGTGRHIAPVVLSAMLLASLAAVGHTQTASGGAQAAHMAADALHLLAAGAWIGGLLALITALRVPDARAVPVLMRFSGMGYVAVATLVATGLVNSWFLVGSPQRLITTPYGQLLLAKLTAFAAMLVLACVNRFWLVPKLKAADGSRWLVRLRRHAGWEFGLGATVLALVAVLGTLQPPAG